MPDLDPASAALADAAAAWRGAYLHVPFCARHCPYCDFAVVVGADDLAGAYVEALIAEIGMEDPWGPLDAVFIGGGTPSRLPEGALRRIVEALRERFGFVPGAEIGLEANPEDWTGDYAAAVAAAGFNRVSLGLQSFDPEVLQRLGRWHDPATAEAAVENAHRAGFASINVDLIYGTPGETLDAWEHSVRRAVATGPHHVSAYALTVEKGTPLSRAVAAGAPAPEPDDQADKYEAWERAMEAAGFVRYEISNAARPGHACRYNLLTWARGEYLAFGTGAHGHRDGVRRRNIRRLDAYLDRVAHGERPESGREVLGPAAREQERLFLGLRRVAGACAGPGGRALLASAWGKRLQSAGVIAVAGDRIRVVKPLLADEAARAVLAVSPGEC
jgi:oxygen-independent coproporphyrinogen-3 oxidase